MAVVAQSASLADVFALRLGGVKNRFKIADARCAFPGGNFIFIADFVERLLQVLEAGAAKEQFPRVRIGSNEDGGVVTVNDSKCVEQIRAVFVACSVDRHPEDWSRDGHREKYRAKRNRPLRAHAASARC